MEWFSRKTSIAGSQIPNWILVLALLWQNLAIDRRYWISKSGFQRFMGGRLLEGRPWGTLR